MKNIQNISLQPFQAINYQLATDELWAVEDINWMQQALNLAKQGAAREEVPVGAILVHNQQIIGQGFNEPIGRHDATAHAEIIALRDACTRLNNYRLPLQTTLYVTLEPCTMCIGALIHARVDRLIYAASEPRAGMVGSQMNLAAESFYNHRIQVYKGLCREHSSQMLKAFFRERRQASKRKKR
ncbi:MULTISPECIES: tRNA adenosine(34) deaminase TadA [Psychrobacter]|uniref:tRNA-specific adenosine deaminase n=1 Tax=Psychrobacter communis TaxID=2762238 RepID=A0ABR8RFH7_9GAMM|nr:MULTISPECIES: tRNA adenosine(34) deaminase TadA [Psychrobacter]MBD7946506.1 tRNA adenosine(34) deaminase TadA [Psychrobacter communis]PKG84322.1 tRNA adenosine(34) deaminase TadA [Psychrobacter sp. Sarcosine-02u-2]WLW65583.1 tRNA adenosine(34) deaminase TadA [Psychrobacter sp. van23A]HCR86965.1 tRNA adenosine(34) deaminase TadA [Psychrobacter sp.]